MSPAGRASSLPAFYQPERAGRMYRPNEPQIIAAAEQSGWTPAGDDAVKRALLLVDCQVDFVFPADDPDFPGSLAVPGAVDDMRRIAEFILRWGGGISSIHASLDAHYVHQIFHGLWWRDAGGRAAAPFTLIPAAAVEQGAYRPEFAPEWSRRYARELERAGKKTLCVWPYHCLMGGPAAAIAPIVFEAMLYHSAARRVPFNLLQKGNEPRTESYGILQPEVPLPDSPIATARGLNLDFLNLLASHDVIYVAGEASSHCVLETLLQMAAHFERHAPEAFAKLRILTDCMSPVPPIPDGAGGVIDFPAIAEKAFADFAARGVKLVKSTDGIGG